MRSKIFFTLLFAVLFSFVTTQNIFAVVKEIEFRNWLDGFKRYAVEHGVEPVVAEKYLDKVRLNFKVIELDKAQPEFKMTFDEYLKKVTMSKMQNAKKEFDNNVNLLNNVASEFNVAPQYIVALWAMESDFGRVIGKFDILESLANLAFEGRRKKFFEKELIDALIILSRGYADEKQMIGSWAGAMGQIQFMPSSLLQYGVDYNSDGKIDIWNDKMDIFASAANYLKKNGWNGKYGWGKKILLPKDFDNKLFGMNIKYTADEWNKFGVRNLDGSGLENMPWSMSIILPDEKKNEAFLVFPNYRVIMSWNKSTYFATSVGLLADSITKLN